MNMQRWLFGIAAGIGLTLAIAASALAQAPARKPNILIIWGDDIGYWNVSAYNQGMMGYKTPNINPAESRRSCRARDMVRCAHAARCIPDNRNARVAIALVRAAQHPSYRGARHAALGPGIRRVQQPGSAIFRRSYRPLRTEAPAGEIRGDRIALEDAAAGERSAHRDSRSEVGEESFRHRDTQARSTIASGNWTAKEIELESFSPEDRSPVLIPIFGFRLMVGMDRSCWRCRGS